VGSSCVCRIPGARHPCPLVSCWPLPPCLRAGCTQFAAPRIGGVFLPALEGHWRSAVQTLGMAGTHAAHSRTHSASPRQPVLQPSLPTAELTLAAAGSQHALLPGSWPSRVSYCCQQAPTNPCLSVHAGVSSDREVGQGGGCRSRAAVCCMHGTGGLSCCPGRGHCSRSASSSGRSSSGSDSSSGFGLGT
jgi:hypothetical protein